MTTSRKKKANSKKGATGAAQRKVEDLGHLLDAMDEEDKEHGFTLKMSKRMKKTKRMGALMKMPSSIPLRRR